MKKQPLCGYFNANELSENLCVISTHLWLTSFKLVFFPEQKKVTEVKHKEGVNFFSPKYGSYKIYWEKYRLNTSSLMSKDDLLNWAELCNSVCPPNTLRKLLFFPFEFNLYLLRTGMETTLLVWCSSVYEDSRPRRGFVQLQKSVSVSSSATESKPQSRLLGSFQTSRPLSDHWTRESISVLSVLRLHYCQTLCWNYINLNIRKWVWPEHFVLLS